MDGRGIQPQREPFVAVGRQHRGDVLTRCLDLLHDDNGPGPAKCCARALQDLLLHASDIDLLADELIGSGFAQFQAAEAGLKQLLIAMLPAGA